MKYIFLVISLFLVFIASAIAAFNSSLVIEMTNPLTLDTITLSFPAVIIVVSVLCILAGATITIFYLMPLMENLQSYKRKIEKLSVEKDSDDSKVRSLEAKIATLEAALKNTLSE